MKKQIVLLLLVFLLVPVSGHAQSAATANSLLFASEDQARQHCPSGIVVWLDNRTSLYYFKGQSWYGNTRRGSFVCQGDADKKGDRPAKKGQ